MQTRLLSLFFATFFAFISSAALADGINWQSYSNGIFARAKQEHKQILLFGKAEWCPWCRRMSDTTYSNNSVIAFVNSHFIPVRVDLDNEPGVASTYNISVVPKTVILNANARTVDSHTGYIDASEMMRFLQANAK